MNKTEKRIKVWVVAWPKGTTKEWKNEGSYAPVDHDPVTLSDYPNTFQYFDEREKRQVWGCPLAIFGSKNEAQAYEKEQGNHFPIRSAYLEIW